MNSSLFADPLQGFSRVELQSRELPGGMVLVASHAWFSAVGAVGQLSHSPLSRDLSGAAAFVGRTSHFSSGRGAVSAAVEPERRSVPN